MQDIHSIGGGSGRLFGGERRMRAHHHQQSQALKCPRCDSLNTKFCYYNNYNLSQPRHFCKSCRRYWTKGGVLRNVPVGGGCRKTKRSKPKPTSSDAPRETKASSHSSSESSSLTATTTAATMPATATTATATEAVSAPSSSSASKLLSTLAESRFFIPQTNASTTKASPSFETTLMDQPPSESALFSEIGSFTSLMTDPAVLGYNVSEVSPFRLHQQSQEQVVQNQHQWQLQKMAAMTEEMKLPEITAEFLDQTPQIELPALQSRSGNGGFAPLDWQSSGDQGLFDLPSSVDQSYWTQSQWTDQDHTLYLP